MTPAKLSEAQVQVHVELAWPAKALSPNARWTTERDNRLRELHGTMTIPAIASEMGTTPGSIRGRVARLGISKKSGQWTASEVAKLRAAYSVEFGEDIGLDGLAAEFGRHKANISRKARSLGLTDIGRQLKRVRVSDPKIGREGSPELRAHLSSERKKWLASNTHPRGMLGKKHTDAVRRQLGEKAAAHWACMTDADRAAHTLKGIKTRLANGTLGPPQIARGSWKAGWREIGGKRKYFRSRWEANYARYLEWLKQRGEIVDWEHEPETFWFEGIKRGVRSYLPDFRVHELNGSKPLHEVKGWMCPRSKTTLKRMAKYHPQETIIVIREKQYNAIARQVRALIPDWEQSGGAGRL